MFYQILMNAAGVPSVEDVVRRAGITPNATIIRRMSYFYPRHVTAIQGGDTGLAAELYRRASAHPDTASTRNFLIGKDITILEGSGSFATQTVVYGHRNHVPVAVKILSKDVHGKELSRLVHLASKEISCASIIKFVLLSQDCYHFLVMPRLVSSLLEINHFFPESQKAFWTGIVAAVEYLHEQGLAHLDIKPANVGVDQDGNFILIDVDNVARLNDVTKVTDEYVPLDFTIRHEGECIARADIDFGLIATTLLAKLKKESAIPRRYLVEVLGMLEANRCEKGVMDQLSTKLQSHGHLNLGISSQMEL